MKDGKPETPMEAACAAACAGEHERLGYIKTPCEVPGGCDNCLELATKIVRAYLNQQLTR